MRRAFIVLGASKPKSVPDHLCHSGGGEVGVFDTQIILEGDLPRAADAAVVSVVAKEALIGDLDVPLGRLVRQAVGACVSLQTDGLRRNQFYVVELRAVRGKDGLDMFQIIM